VQSRVWKMGFLILALLMMTCGVVARRRSRSLRAETDGSGFIADRGSREAGAIGGPRTAPTAGTWLRWLIFVGIPSSWLMGVTTYLTTDLAAVPLLWVIPLALYLLSFILAFADRASGLVRFAARAVPILVVPLVL